MRRWGSPGRFCSSLAQPAGRVQVNTNSEVGCPSGMGIITSSPYIFLRRARSQIYSRPHYSLLRKGAIEPALRNRSLGVFSRLFLVPKKTGDLRPVIDVSTLNQYLVVPHNPSRWRYRPKSVQYLLT